MGNFAEVIHGEIKQRAYDEQRELLCNYKTVLSKEEALQKVTVKDLEEGMVSMTFSKSEPMRKYPQVLLNSLGAEIQDLTLPDVRAMVDSAQ